MSQFCCFFWSFTLAILIALGVAAALLYKGVPEAELDKVVMKDSRFTQYPPTIYMDFDIHVLVDNPNGIGARVDNVQASMFYPQKSTNKV
eukprot:CAMPEP_0114545368 /NCGR_PEP_ID=MMETSP0114-20121206/3362_1 /TAXON_ID=31324 /ORGANISM="Goniomonas sp, Strain m" /LENGTH=89 /DNA_ID=CAMNT_0001729789 /DNA_START=23 /DNA_END=288 /DNA_ORIENTATION=-